MLYIFDLDETLIHSIRVEGSYDSVVEQVKNANLEYFILELSEDTYYIVTIRPYTREFIQFISEMYDIAIWSAGTYSYVHYIAEQLFANVDVKVILTRDDCEPNGTKNLSKIVDIYNNRYPEIKLSDIILMDDKMNVTEYDALNHFLILPFDEIDYDTLLLDLMKIISSTVYCITTGPALRNFMLAKLNN